MPRHQCLSETFTFDTYFWSIGKGKVVLQMVTCNKRRLHVEKEPCVVQMLYLQRGAGTKRSQM